MGFTEKQTLKIRKANISFNSKLNALVQFAKEIVENKGEVSEGVKANFFDEGYNTENLVDVLMTVGDKIITNYLFALVKVRIDFPESHEV